MISRTIVVFAAFLAAVAGQDRPPKPPGADMSREDRRKIAIEMHDLWCKAHDGFDTKVPCMMHVVAQDLENKKIDHTGISRGSRIMKEIDEKVGPELKKQHNTEMHDWYCARTEAVEAPEDSSMRAFCDGWEHRKQMEAKTEL